MRGELPLAPRGGLRPAPDLGGLRPAPDLYPFEGRYLDLDGLRLHYLDEGAGEPVLMLHGNPTWSFFYRQLVLGLRANVRTIAPDHIGCGRSDKPSARRYPYQLAQRVQDVERLIAHLRLDQPLTLVLHDWGGMIGMAYAVRNPQRIGRLVLFNTAAFPLPPGKRFPWQLALCRSALLGSVLVRGLNLFCRGAARSCVVRPMSREVRNGFLAPYDSWAHRIAVHRFVQDIPRRRGDPAYEIMAQVDASLDQFRGLPVLICWGLRDFVFDEHFLAEWCRRFPQAQVHRFPDAGHYLLEDAGQEILELVARFLRSSCPESPRSGPRIMGGQ